MRPKRFEVARGKWRGKHGHQLWHNSAQVEVGDSRPVRLRMRRSISLASSAVLATPTRAAGRTVHGWVESTIGSSDRYSGGLVTYDQLHPCAWEGCGYFILSFLISSQWMFVNVHSTPGHHCPHFALCNSFSLQSREQSRRFACLLARATHASIRVCHYLASICFEQRGFDHTSRVKEQRVA